MLPPQGIDEEATDGKMREPACQGRDMTED
jgi:hypothetical protein